MPQWSQKPTSCCSFDMIGPCRNHDFIKLASLTLEAATQKRHPCLAQVTETEMLEPNMACLLYTSPSPRD
eukprot:532446-Alexandrium_andersonii.AAC.1